ncbi:MAG TPA: COX15/CtaA family protein [Candidatus Methylomirabilis sp.]|nr:COX15/CtaA family protein [Candidatus Methylomirabilis sp.]
MAARASLASLGNPPGNPWPHRLAVVTAGATFILILVGGLVTNTDSGLAVPDWPTTFGYNMFLYPWSGMVGGILYEHTHRLIGSVVGLLTLTLSLVTWAVEPRRWLRWLVGAALGAVILQGILGGLRVVLVEETLAILHGILAQAFFGLTGALVLFTSRGWSEPTVPVRGGDAGPLRWLSRLTTVAIFLQIVFGALLTHLDARLDAHLTLAALIAVLVPLLSGRVWGILPEQRELTRSVAILCGLLGLQLLLGLGSYVSRFTEFSLPLAPFSRLALPVGHRLIGGLMLVSSLALTLRLHRLLGSDESVPDRGPVSRRVSA